MATSLAADRAGAAPAAVPRRTVDWLLAVALVGLVALFVRAIWFTPPDAMQGPAQKILYVHATSAFVGLYLAFGVMAISSGVYLFLRDERLDLMAESAAEVGLVFTSAVLLTGPLWGKPIWGTWWTWDARLTLTLFLWFIILGYLVLRGAVDDAAMRARYSAVIGVLAAPLVLLIHLSVYLFRTLHPMPVVLKPGVPGLTREMGITFTLGFLVMTTLFVALLRGRYRLALLRRAIERRDAEDRR